MDARIYGRQPTDTDLVHAVLVGTGEAEPRILAALLRIEDLMLEGNNLQKQILAALTTPVAGKGKKASESAADAGA